MNNVKFLLIDKLIIFNNIILTFKNIIKNIIKNYINYLILQLLIIYKFTISLLSIISLDIIE